MASRAQARLLSQNKGGDMAVLACLNAWLEINVKSGMRRTHASTPTTREEDVIVTRCYTGVQVMVTPFVTPCPDSNNGCKTPATKTHGNRKRRETSSITGAEYVGRVRG